MPSPYCIDFPKCSYILKIHIFNQGDQQEKNMHPPKIQTVVRDLIFHMF